MSTFQVWDGSQSRCHRLAAVVDFIKNNDIYGSFKSIATYRQNFVDHMKKLLEVGQIMVCEVDGDLRGLCSWIITDDKRFLEINKIRWTMPENISAGNILYVDTIVLSDGISVFGIKRKFEDMGYRNFIKEVKWFNMVSGHKFNSKIF